MPTLDDAIQYVRMGNRERGRQILEEILETDENNEEVWLWLSAVVDSDEDREICLENVLALDPNNGLARRGLEAVQAGNFNSNQMLGELLEQEGASIESTFTDDFVTADEGLDEELTLPSTMAKTKSKPKAKPKTKGRGLPINPRLLILAALVLLVVVALAAIAAYSIFSGGGDTTIVPGDTPPTQPVQPEQEVVPAATDTPAATLAPTDTPTPTATRLQLPTAVPTREPTPTATRVVSPTPVR